MTSGLSRRAVLRALVPVTPPREAPPEALVASIGAACVEPQGVSCRRCGEVCDEKAIRFVPLAAGRAAPVLAPALCSGCGECLAPCPVTAIRLVLRAPLAREAALLARGAAALGGEA